jgi:hypothetical protein
MVDYWPTPPATGVWWDPDETFAAVMQILRLPETGDVDEDRVKALIPAAGALIDYFVDRETIITGPPPPPTVQTALELITVDLYRRPQTAPIIAGDVAALYATLDPAAPYWAMLLPFKARWGLA